MIVQLELLWKKLNEKFDKLEEEYKNLGEDNNLEKIMIISKKEMINETLVELLLIDINHELQG